MVRPWRSRSAASIVIVLPSRRRPPTERPNDRFEEHQPVAAAEHRLAGAFRVRHHADDVAALAADSGDVPRGAVRVRGSGRLAGRGVDVAEDHAAIPLERVEHVVGREVVALAVVDRNAQDLAARRPR